MSLLLLSINGSILAQSSTSTLSLLRVLGLRLKDSQPVTVTLSCKISYSISLLQQNFHRLLCWSVIYIC